MWKTVLNRLIVAVPTVLVASLMVLLLVELIPGDPAIAIAGENATAERLAAIRQELGLEKPLATRYVEWLGAAVQGDLGTSYRTGEDVVSVLQRRLPATLQIAVLALVIAVVIGIAAGMLAAVKADSRFDRFVKSASSFGLAMPNFWLAMLLVSVLSLQFRLFPAIGYTGVSESLFGAVHSLFLPALAVGVAGAAELAKQSRSGLLSVMSTDYWRTHRAKGLSPRYIIMRHGLRNAGLPLVTLIGLLFGRFISASVVVEVIFAIPGTGSLMLDAVKAQDFPVIQGFVVVLAVIVVAVNLVVDLLYRVLDPRLRLQRGKV